MLACGRNNHTCEKSPPTHNDINYTILAVDITFAYLNILHGRARQQ